MNITIRVDVKLPPLTLKYFYIELFRETLRNARAGKDIAGRPFTPLAPVTRQARIKQSSVPLNDRGRLMASLRYSIQGKHHEKMQISSNLIYAAIHLFGGVIRPKRARMLAIPVAPRFTRLGPRHFLLFRIGKALFLKPTGRSKNFVMAYILREEVKIPQRPYLPVKGIPQNVINELAKRVKFTD